MKVVVERRGEGLDGDEFKNKNKKELTLLPANIYPLALLTRFW
jgi:hypothetical protein